ncbi:tetratricopeptide repeat protein [Acanthopleuribacter pedis]|uniref:Tetratricopeptide repeat protein n=1 Tax=Acanthopleuribacter pedis TaxID=442870 RepID=A0A8J7QCW0_9BACT|nr:tetratricopeptide repeat protein [Acanthopleuribacter pedis]MBO1321789.1 tetratricopeptide repeat protein [Acanthopleuribacter pedis]
MTESQEGHAETTQTDPLLPGFKLMEEGRLDEAVAFFQEAASKYPRDWRVFAQLGQLQLANEKHHQAIYNFTRSMETAPDRAAILILRALAFLEIKDVGQAEADAEQAWPLAGENVESWNRLGVIYGRLGEFDRAQTAYEQALELQPRAASVYFNRAVMMAEAQDFVAAVDDYREALEVADGPWPEALLGMGVSLVKIDDHDEAIECFRAVLELKGADSPMGRMARRYLSELNALTEADAAPQGETQAITPAQINDLIREVSRHQREEEVARLFRVLVALPLYTNPVQIEGEEPQDPDAVRLPVFNGEEGSYVVFYADEQDERLRPDHIALPGDRVMRWCMDQGNIEGLMVQNTVGDNVCYHKNLFPALLARYDRFMAEHQPENQD